MFDFNGDGRFDAMDLMLVEDRKEEPKKSSSRPTGAGSTGAGCMTCLLLVMVLGCIVGVIV